MSDLEKKTEEEQVPQSHTEALAQHAKDAESTGTEEQQSEVSLAGAIGQITELRKSRRQDREQSSVEISTLTNQVAMLTDRLVGLNETPAEKSPMESFAEENPDEQPTAEVLVEQQKYQNRQDLTQKSKSQDDYLKAAQSRVRAEVKDTPLPFDVVMAFADTLTLADKSEIAEASLARNPDIAKMAYDRIIKRTPQLQQFLPKDAQTTETDKTGDESENEETDTEETGSVVDAHANAVFGLG